MGETPDAKYDRPLKRALRLWPQQYFEMFHPDIYEEVDWTHVVEQLDKELQKIMPEAQTGDQVVDKLYKVRLKSGRNAHILIHVEIQMIYDAGYLRRLCVYNLTLFLAYGEDVITTTLLGDPAATDIPDSFSYGLGKYRTSGTFAVARTTDFLNEETLEKFRDNPYMFLVRAISRTQETHHQSLNRLNAKTLLASELINGDYPPDISHQLLNMIEEMMSLPEELNPVYKENVEAMLIPQDEEYIAFFEIPAIEKGIEKGKEIGLKEGKELGAIDSLQNAILKKLTARYGKLSEDFVAKIREVRSIEMLEELIEIAITVNSLAAFEEQFKLRSHSS